MTGMVTAVMVLGIRRQAARNRSAAIVPERARQRPVAKRHHAALEHADLSAVALPIAKRQADPYAQVTQQRVE
ncbi:MAG: hypothetical protein ACKOTB_06685, partial [Planctomycetia bacterium]